MKSFRGVFTGALLLLLVLLSSLSEAAVPGTLTYQGRLTNSSGLAITGQVDITFNIYSVPTGGAPLWTQTIAGVTVVNGIFTATLGTVVNPINSSVISGADVYIGVKVGTDVEMMPRQKFAAVPYSVKASEADTVVDGAITAAKLANICSTGEVLVKSGSTWTCAMPSVLASCYNGDFVSCYGADPSTIGVGPCRSGIRTCNGNSFSAACLGEVTPVTETCDGTDEDCNGVVDDAPGAPTWYGDADNDTFGNAAKPLVKCTQPAGYVSNSTDCGDTNEFVNPVRPEICDGLDNDCNSQIDDSCVTAACTGDEQSQVFECGAMCGGSDMMCIADCLNSMGLTAECHGSVTTLGMCVFNVGDPACLTNMTCWRQTCSAEYGAAFGPECKSGVTRSCGPGTEVGACQSGTETCVSGFWSGVCAGAVYQSADMCDGLDNNCNGITDETPDTICGLGGSCVSGACQCFGGFTACSSQCVNTDDDMFNCGACGNDCLAAVPDGADTFCSSGTCQYMCMGGRDDCNGTMADGCETDLWFDTANCGACGNDCASQVGANATPACDGAMCRAVCNSGFEDCNGDPVDGCEADLLSDPNNCGWCNNTADDGDMCNGAETCVSGTVSSGAPLSCDDGVSCTADFCQSFVGCEHVTQDFMCDDGNVCTSDYCDVSNGCMGAPFDAPIGDVCSTGLPGVCADGATACSGGATTCVQNNLPSAEVCDGSDNDCDGQSDEGGVCAVCGDGIVSVSEQCDDGNTMSGDGCQSTCLAEPGYQCLGSPSVCQTLCGDGISAGSEQCDDGNMVDTDSCTNTCMWPVCRDGIVSPSIGEQCDDGNMVNTDFCTNTCTLPVCGDGIVSPSIGEQCDDGNASNADSCTNTCTTPTCSDAMQNGSETGVDCGGACPVCAGSCVVAADCPGSDTSCQARTCVAGVCGVEYAADGTSVAVQTAGNCQMTVCDGAGGTKDVVDDADVPTSANQCADGVCTAGVPGMQFKADGTACADGDACTQTDMCQGGTCTGYNPVTCVVPDQCHDAGTCNPSTGVCSSSPAKADGTACTENGGVECMTGVCVPPVCSPTSVVISQVYFGGPVGPYNQDFVELHNRSTNTVNISDWGLYYGGPTVTGNAWQPLLGSPLVGTIPPGGYLLIRTGSVGGGSPVPANVTGTALEMDYGAPGKVVLMNAWGTPSGTACPPDTAATVDIVGWGNGSAGCQEGAPISAYPIGNPAVSVARGGAGCTDTNVNAADFSVVGSIIPRSALTSPVSCGCR